VAIITNINGIHYSRSQCVLVFVFVVVVVDDIVIIFMSVVDKKCPAARDAHQQLMLFMRC
jgi:hypothetical protein